VLSRDSRDRSVATMRLAAKLSTHKPVNFASRVANRDMSRSAILDTSGGVGFRAIWSPDQTSIERAEACILMRPGGRYFEYRSR
jgi:hypothetical protein